MKFIVIEGLDGSGKSTQVKKLLSYLEENNIRFKYLHFPVMESPIFGELASMFLRGDLGSLDMVNPYLVALIYAGDRNNAKQTILDWLANDCLVVIDRYVYSNIAFQCAKVNGIEEQNKLANWILNMEFEYYKIPKPDLSVFFDVPFEFTQKNLTNQREGEDRDYLNGKVDIHEANLDFQKNVREIYLRYSNADSSMNKIDCSNGKGEMHSPDEIFQKLINVLKNKKVL